MSIFDDLFRQTTEYELQVRLSFCVRVESLLLFVNRCFDSIVAAESSFFYLAIFDSGLNGATRFLLVLAITESTLPYVSRNFYKSRL